MQSNENRCIRCGDIIPEGTWICPQCDVDKNKCVVCGNPASEGSEYCDECEINYGMEKTFIKMSHRKRIKEE